VRTLRDVPEHCETGGAEIGPYYARVLSEATRFGLTLKPGAIPKIDFALNIDGTLMSAASWAQSPVNRIQGPARALPPFALSGAILPRESSLKELESWLEESRHDDDPSLLDLCRRQSADPQFMRLLMQGIEGESLALESVLWARRKRKIAEWSGASLAGFAHIEGGMSRLPNAMAASLKGDVILGREITAITTDTTGAEVRCADGTRYRSKRVICTLPLPVLCRVPITPRLPALQLEAITRIPFGEAVSLYLRIKAPFWEVDGLGSSLWSDTCGRAMHWATPSGSYIWVIVSGPSSRRYRDLQDADLSAALIADLVAARPSMAGRVEPIAVMNWSAHPYSRGTFAGRAPGQIGRYGNIAARPHGHIHFAGEHTAELLSGLEGAMESGERVAVEVLRTL
jgi:monoamine oxidase